MKTMALCLALCLTIFWDKSVFAQPIKLVLNASYSSPIVAPDKSGFLDRLYQELFRRLGIPVEIQALPAERALQNANDGIDDGDVCRVAGLTDSYTNLVRTSESVMTYQHVVFSRTHRFRMTGPASLEPYDVGIVTGLKIIEQNTIRHRTRIMLDDAEQLFRMLDQGRVEVAVIERTAGTYAVKKLGLAGIGILSPPLLTGDWYLYLHKRHADLIPRIDRELRAMKHDGTYERIRRDVLGPYEQGL